MSNVCDDGSFSYPKECRRSLASEGVAVCGFFAWAGKFLHCFRGGAVGGGVTPTFRIIISGIKRFKYKACDAGKTAVY